MTLKSSFGNFPLLVQILKIFCILRVGRFLIKWFLLKEKKHVTEVTLHAMGEVTGHFTQICNIPEETVKEVKKA